MIVAGLGFRQECDAGEIVTLLERALTEAAQPFSSLQALAIPALKADSRAPREAADRLGVDMILVDADALKGAEPRCATLSPTSKAKTGVASVAEAAALAGAGTGSVLVLPRIKSARATCALARAAAP